MRPFSPLQVEASSFDSFERMLKKFTRLVKEDGTVKQFIVRARGFGEDKRRKGPTKK